MTDDDLMSRLHDLNPVREDPAVPTATEMRRRISSARPRRLGRPRTLPTLLAGVLAAGAVAAVSTATNGGSSTPPAATAPLRIVDGSDLAQDLASSPSVGVAATHLDSSIIELLATGGYGVNVSRAWEIAVPDDARPAWLFAGDRRLALVVPRALKGPDGSPRSGAVSVFGESVAEIRKAGLVGTQSGGGQSSRVIVLLPPQAPAPSIVQKGSSETVRPLDRSGQLFVGEPGVGEQVLVPSQPAGRQRFAGAK